MGLPFGRSKRAKRSKAASAVDSDAENQPHSHAIDAPTGWTRTTMNTMPLGRNQRGSPRRRTWSVGGDTGHSEALQHHRPSERKAHIAPSDSSSSKIIRHFLPHHTSASEQEHEQHLASNASKRQHDLLNSPHFHLANDSAPLNVHGDNEDRETHRYYPQTQGDSRWTLEHLHQHHALLDSRPPEDVRRRSLISGPFFHASPQTLIPPPPLASTTIGKALPPPPRAPPLAPTAYDGDDFCGTTAAASLAPAHLGGVAGRRTTAGATESSTHYENTSNISNDLQTNHNFTTTNTSTNQTPLRTANDVFSPSHFSHYPQHSSREANNGGRHSFYQSSAAADRSHSCGVDVGQTQQQLPPQHPLAQLQEPADSKYGVSEHHHQHQQQQQQQHFHRRQYSAVSEVPHAAPSSTNHHSENRKRLSRFSLRSAFGSLLRPSSIRKKGEGQGDLTAAVAPSATVNSDYTNNANMDVFAQTHGPAGIMQNPGMSAHIYHEQQLLLQQQQQNQQHQQQSSRLKFDGGKAEPFPSIWHSSEDDETDGGSAMPGELFNMRRGIAPSNGTRHRSATSASGPAPSINSSRQGGRRRGGSLTVPASSSLASGSNPPSRSSCRRGDDDGDDEDEDEVHPVHLQGVAAPRRVGLQTSRSSIIDHTHAPNASLQVQLLDSRTGAYALQAPTPSVDANSGYPMPLSSKHRLSSRGLAGEADWAQSVVHEDRREDTTSLISSPPSSMTSHQHLPEPEPTKPSRALSTLRKFFAGRTARTSNPTPVPNGLVQQGAHANNGFRHPDDMKRSQLPLPTRAHSSMDGPVGMHHQPLHAGLASKRASLGPTGYSYVDGFPQTVPESPPLSRLRASDSWTEDQRGHLLPTIMPGSLPTSPTRGRSGSMKKRENGVSDRLRFYRKQSGNQVAAAAAGPDSDNMMSRSASRNTFASAHSTDRALTLQALKGVSLPTPQESPVKKTGAVGPGLSSISTSVSAPGFAPVGSSMIPSMWKMADEVPQIGNVRDGLPLTLTTEVPSVSAMSYKTASPQLSDIASSNQGRSPMDDYSPGFRSSIQGRSPMDTHSLGHHSLSTFNPVTPRTDPMNIVRPLDPVTHSGGRRLSEKRPVDAESGASSSQGPHDSVAAYKRRNTFGSGNEASAMPTAEDLQASATSALFHSPAPPSLQESFVMEIERDLKAVEKALVNNRREGSFDPTSLRKRLSTLMPKVLAVQPSSRTGSQDSEEGGFRGRNRVTLNSTSQLAILEAVRRLKTTIEESQILDGPEEAVTADQTRASIELGDLSSVSKLSSHQKGLKEIEMAYDRMRDLVSSAIGVSAASTPVVSSGVTTKRTRANVQASAEAGTPSARVRTQSTTAIPTPPAPLASPIQGPRWPSDSARTKRLSALMGLPHPPREVSNATSQADTVRDSGDLDDGGQDDLRDERAKHGYRSGSASASASGSLAARSQRTGSVAHHRDGSSHLSVRRQTPGRGGREDDIQQQYQPGSNVGSPRSALVGLASPAVTFGHIQSPTEFGSIGSRGALGVSPGTLTRSLPTSNRAGMVRSPWTVSSGLTSVFNSGEGAALSEPDNPAMETMRRRHELERNSLLDALEQTRTENAHLQTANRQLQSDLHAEVTRVLQLERELERQMAHGETLGARLGELDLRVGELQAELAQGSALERYELSISRLPPGHSPIGLSDLSDEGSYLDSRAPSGSGPNHGGPVMSSPTVVQSVLPPQTISIPSVATAREVKGTRPRPTSSPSLHNYPSVLGLEVDERELRWTLADEKQPRGTSPSPDKHLHTDQTMGVATPEDLVSAPFPSIPTSQFLERNTRARGPLRDSPLGVSSTISTSPNSFNVSGPSSTDRTSAPSDSVGGGNGSVHGLGLHHHHHHGQASAGGGSGQVKPSSMYTSSPKRVLPVITTTSSSSPGGATTSPRRRRATFEGGDRIVSAATTGASSSFTAQTESPAASYVSGFGPVSKTFRDMLQEDDSVNL
ncbi:hypothetical protein CF319_g1615 [Tilletia indica]|nr:hypothetical protein CF319_g1615 [Tilletia indica]